MTRRLPQRAIRWLYYWARNPERKPFFLYVSLSHPHDPYVTPQRYWDRYDHDSIDLPVVPAIPPEKRDPYGAWLYRHYDRSEYEVTEAHIRTARHAYYANISLVDDLIGGVLDTLRNIRELDDTAIVFCADHGDMLGERGLWYKMAPYERSTRIPLIVWKTPDAKGGRRVSANVSLIDVLPTVLDLAGEGGSLDPIEPLDGTCAPSSPAGARAGRMWRRASLFFEGLAEPALMLRKGRYKYIRCNRQAQLLFDIESDPHDLHDLAGDPAQAAKLAELRGLVARLGFRPADG